MCISSFIGCYLLPQEAQARLFLKILDIDKCTEGQSANASCKNSVSSITCSGNAGSIMIWYVLLRVIDVLTCPREVPSSCSQISFETEVLVSVN